MTLILRFYKKELLMAEFEGTKGALWCPKCRVNHMRIKARMIRDGTW